MAPLPPPPKSAYDGCHSLNGSSDSVNGDFQFLWQDYLIPHKIDTLETIDKKIVTVDYVREGTP